MERLIELSKTLIKRKFVATVCENKFQAVDIIHNMVSECSDLQSIGFGNSMTINDLNLKKSLRKYTENIYIHVPVGTKDIDRLALTADFYFASANDISMDGHIVNIDGTGNRVASTCFGPKHVIYVIGKNKIVNTLEDAMVRAKDTAIKIAKKYNRKTPCNVTGKCSDCLSPECVCAITTIHRKKPYGLDITIILIDEDLGL